MPLFNPPIATQLKGILAKANGGFGQDMSTANGIAKWAAGALSFLTTPAGAIVGDTDTQTLTNKTLTAPTINNPIIQVTGGVTGDIQAYDATLGQLKLAHPRIYGNGEDGIVTDTASGTHARQYQFASWTLTTGAAIDVKQNPTFIKDLFDLTTAPTGAIVSAAVNANAASVNVAGAAVSSTLFQNGCYGGGTNISGGSAGSGGATAAGTTTPATNVTGAYTGGLPGPVGTAGTGNAGANAAGVSTAWTVSGPASTPRHGELEYPNGAVNSAPGSSGGGDGTATASGAGASSAMPGQYVAINARQVLTSSSNANASVIQAKGGNGAAGGTPAAGNRGGGCPSAGAGGGCIRICCEEKLGTTHTNCLDVSGGTGGNAGTGAGTGTSGTGAGCGFGGQAIVYLGGASPTTTVTNRRATGGTAGSGITGATAVAALCNL